MTAAQSVRKLIQERDRLKKQNERYREALRYVRHQAYYGNQVRGIEESTYLAWIHERCSKALRISKYMPQWKKPIKDE